MWTSPAAAGEAVWAPQAAQPLFSRLKDWQSPRMRVCWVTACLVYRFTHTEENVPTRRPPTMHRSRPSGWLPPRSRCGLTHLARAGLAVRSRAASCCCRGWRWRCWHGLRLRCRRHGNQRDCDNLIITAATDTWPRPPARSGYHRQLWLCCFINIYSEEEEIKKRKKVFRFNFRDGDVSQSFSRSGEKYLSGFALG